MTRHSFLKQSVSSLMVVLLFPVVSLGQQSPYTGQQSREIKVLSSDLYESMRQDAIRLGKRLIEEERRLDHLFATQAITADKLEEVTRDIARYQGELRQVHRRAHLAQRRLLTAQQLQHYDALRGYTSDTQHPHRHKH